MPFFSPAGPLPALPNVPIHEFLFDERHGCAPCSSSLRPMVCGLTGKSYTTAETQARVELLAYGLAQEMGWSVNDESEWDKVVAHFSVNTIDSPTVFWATHRIGGILTPANAAYSVSELVHQLTASRAKCVFTSLPHLKDTLEAVDKVGMPRSRVFLIELDWMPLSPSSEHYELAKRFKTVDQLIEWARESSPGASAGVGATVPLEPLRWGPAQADRVAFLCYSSGTSGMPKGVKIAHRNVIANVAQLAAQQVEYRASLRDKNLVVLGLLPMSHIFGLIVVVHCSVYRGDSVIVLPKFEIKSFLSAIQQFKIHTLYLVPPIIILMAKNRALLDKYNLSSVQVLFTGAAPLGEETVTLLEKQRPEWTILQGYGLTETCTVVSAALPDDQMLGSSGPLVPGVEVRLIAPPSESASILSGTQQPLSQAQPHQEITAYNTPGELWVRSPSVTLGYLDNPTATAESYTDSGFFKTGDEVVIRKNPKTGTDHLFIVDRIKELIKVKGFQVPPAELEAHILTSEYVDDVAVIPVPDESAGEVPKAFVVKSAKAMSLSRSTPGSTQGSATGGTTATATLTDAQIAQSIVKHVQDHKSKYKWLRGGVEFVSVIPKSPSGKILRRILKDMEKERRAREKSQTGAKL